MDAALKGKAKQTEISRLLDKLQKDLENKLRLSLQEKTSALQTLKLLGRQVQDADPLFTENGIRILSRHGFGSNAAAGETSREALRCLANTMLLKPPTRQIFVDLGFVSAIADHFHDVGEFDDEFLCARVLFLLTYDTELDLNDVIENHRLADSASKHLSHHAGTTRQKAPGQRTTRGQVEGMALSQTLKLVYNVLHYYPPHALRFAPCTNAILELLALQQPLPKPAMEPPVNDMINTLLTLDLTKCSPSTAFPDEDPERLVAVLIDALASAIKSYPPQDLDVSVSPCVSLLRALHDLAPEPMRAFMRQRLLPGDDERSKPLGQADTLPAHLLRFSTSGFTPTLRETIPIFLFELSDRDAEKFVKNVGYGYASGFLANYKIPAPPPPGADGGERGRGGTASESDVNFVTGQYLKDEPQPQEPPMTEEEKMQEAERLFVLFERLKKTGVVDVKNPVEDAVESGRFEELD